MFRIWGWFLGLFLLALVIIAPFVYDSDRGDEPDCPPCCSGEVDQ